MKIANFGSIKNTVLVGECADTMSQFPADCIDLTVTSPPYGNLRDYNGYKFDYHLIALELFRVTKPGSIVVWIMNDTVVNCSETGESFRQALYFMSIGFNLHDTMIYDKNGVRYPDPTRYHNVFEYMFIFSKGRPKTMNFIEDRKKKYVSKWGNSSGKIRRQKTGELLTGSEDFKKPAEGNGRRYNIWKFATGAGYSTKDTFAWDHPAIFPEKLAEDHIVSWSNPGDLVLDPMAGSGTTLKMARINNRDFIGIEMSPEYAKLAERRVTGVTSAFPGMEK